MAAMIMGTTLPITMYKPASTCFATRYKPLPPQPNPITMKRKHSNHRVRLLTSFPRNQLCPLYRINALHYIKKFECCLRLVCLQVAHHVPLARCAFQPLGYWLRCSSKSLSQLFKASFASSRQAFASYSLNNLLLGMPHNSSP